MIQTLSIIAPLFLILGVGIVAGLRQRFRGAHAGMNAFVFYISLPAFLFVAVSGAPLSDVPFAFVGITLGVTGAVFALVFGLTTLRRRSTPGGSAVTPGILSIAATYGNVGYLGVPIALSIVGPEAALAAALGQLLHNVLFMVGYPVLKSIGSSRAVPPQGGKTSSLAVLWLLTKQSILLNPVTLSIAAGLLVNVLHLELPEPVALSIEMLGGAAVPTAMFAVGLTIKPAFEGVRSGGVSVGAVVVSSVVKLAVLPLATLSAVLVFGGGLAQPWVAVAVIMAAMPVSSTASVLAFEYDGDSRVVAATTLVTSMFAVITIPALITLVL